MDDLELIYRSFYLGPYILVTRQKKDLRSSIYHCPNNKCKNHGIEMLESMKYCYACSERLGFKPTVDHNYLCTCDVIEDQNLFDVSHVKGMEKLGDGCRVLMPNQDLCEKKSYDRDVHFNKMDVGHGLCADIDINFEIEDFYSDVCKEIKQLKSAYGEGNVKILWGLINYE